MSSIDRIFIDGVQLGPKYGVDFENDYPDLYFEDLRIDLLPPPRHVRIWLTKRENGRRVRLYELSPNSHIELIRPPFPVSPYQQRFVLNEGICQ